MQSAHVSGQRRAEGSVLWRAARTQHSGQGIGDGTRQDQARSGGGAMQESGETEASLISFLSPSSFFHQFSLCVSNRLSCKQRFRQGPALAFCLFIIDSSFIVSFAQTENLKFAQSIITDRLSTKRHIFRFKNHSQAYTENVFGVKLANILNYLGTKILIDINIRDFPKTFL